MARMSAGGWEFGFEETGSGPPIILLHGLLMDRTMWEAQVGALKDRGRVIAVDAPGHGESPPRPPGFTLREEAAALTAALATIGAGERAVWVGHSMGGMKSFEVALDHPDRVRALVLIDTQPYPENPEVLPQYDAMLEVLKAQGPSEDLASVVGSIMFGDAALATPEGQRWVKHFATLGGARIEGTCRAVFDRPGIGDRVGEITAPSLVVHGTDDTPIPIEAARRYAGALPNARLVEIEGAGHTTPVERADEVSEAIRSFLDTL